MNFPIQHGDIEIVNFPIQHGDFSIVNIVMLIYQRVMDMDKWGAQKRPAFRLGDWYRLFDIGRHWPYVLDMTWSQRRDGRKWRDPAVHRFSATGWLPSGYVNSLLLKMDHLWWIYPLKMVIFHSYVSLPEGICRTKNMFSQCSVSNTEAARLWHYVVLGGCTFFNPKMLFYCEARAICFFTRQSKSVSELNVDLVELRYINHHKHS